MPHLSVTRTWLLGAAAAALVAALAGPGPAAAANCGGSTPCKCGDTVTRSIKLSKDLGVCTATGLRVLSGVTLDCGGRTITGNDQSNAKYGVLLDGAVSATVKNCRITGFRKGIRLSGGRGNTISGNAPFTNHDYGIELSGGSSGNTIAGNNVFNNRDEGIHVGAGADDNVIRQNTVTRNKNENVYVLSSDRTQIVLNTITTNDSAAILIKHGRDSYVGDNAIYYGAVYVRGASVDNVFEDNALRGNGYFFEAYQETTGWTFPHDNTVTGGKVENTKACLRFGGAYDNEVDGLALDDECKVTMWPVGGQAASGNVIKTVPLP